MPVTSCFHRRCRVLAAAACVLAALSAATHAQTGLLNDTGQTQCDNGSNVLVPCTSTNTGDTSAMPRQDGRFGRDAAQAAGQLPAKTGAGAAGFDFTKIANNGTALAAGATLGTGTTDWACTRDNVTGLVWEVKTTSGLRSSHTYTWYSASNNGGNPGSVGSNTCDSTLSAVPYNNQCNTANYVAAVNAAGMCGATDWRMPTRRELLGIVHNGLSTGPMVDVTYFPNTQSNWYWTSDTYAPYPAGAWIVVFGSGYTGAISKTYLNFVRLVRSGQ